MYLLKWMNVQCIDFIKRTIALALTNINKTSMIYRHDLIKKLDALRDSNSELAQMVLDQV